MLACKGTVIDNYPRETAPLLVSFFLAAPVERIEPLWFRMANGHSYRVP